MDKIDRSSAKGCFLLMIVCASRDRESLSGDVVCGSLWKDDDGGWGVEKASAPSQPRRRNMHAKVNEAGSSIIPPCRYVGPGWY